MTSGIIPACDAGTLATEINGAGRKGAALLITPELSGLDRSACGPRNLNRHG